jgi:3-deoxy-D-manno-octulosonic-acid transferase
VPVAIVSARLSERSLSHYRTLGSGLRELVHGLAGVLCQSDADARRWVALGAEPTRVEVVGNLKIDALPEPASSRPTARLSLGLDPDRPLLVLGSVRPGELRLIARAWLQLPETLRAHWQVAIVPRHARATRELREELASSGGAASQLAKGGGASSERAAATALWHWDDRAGVLNAYYAAAEVAFVGGSLLAYGGHNPLEPAACGAAVVMGSHHRSQLPAVQALAGESGITIVSGDRELAEALERLLGDPSARARQTAAAHRALAALRGAAKRAVARLTAWGLARHMIAALANVAASLYGAGWEVRRRSYACGWRTPQRAGARVVSIGNLTAGGTGKRR